MAVHVPWLTPELDDSFQDGADRNSQALGRLVVFGNETYWWLASKVGSCVNLDTPYGFGSVTHAPETTRHCPLDLRLWPVVRRPKTYRAGYLPSAAFYNRKRTIAAELPVAHHACHCSPAFAFRKRSAESESCALRITVVLVQCVPVVINELSKCQARRVDLGWELHGLGQWCL